MVYIPKKRKPSNRKFKKKLFGEKAHMPCHYCGKKLPFAHATFDHVRPRSKGGYQKLKNGVIACRPCNQAKGSMSKGEFIEMIRKKASEKYD